jgi:hypothetical protein
MPIGSFTVFQPIGKIFDNPPILSHIYAMQQHWGLLCTAGLVKIKLKRLEPLTAHNGRPAFGLRATT